MARRIKDSANIINKRLLRLELCNKVLMYIGQLGHHFFNHNGITSQFAFDRLNRVVFIDGYTDKVIYIDKRNSWRGFTQGGTLRNLVERMHLYINGKGPFPLNNLKPEPDFLCDGDVWGYGKENRLAIVKYSEELLDKLGF